MSICGRILRIFTGNLIPMSLNFDGQEGDYLHKNNSNSFYIFLPFSFQLELVCKHGFPCDFKKIINFLIFFILLIG
jgi:hypothetical protein